MGKLKTYGHKNSASIEKTRVRQLDSMKGFKGAKLTSSEWLTKQKKVRQKTM